MDGPQLVFHPVVRTIVGLLAIAGAIGDGFFFVLFPALGVPSPANYLFYVSWLIPIGLTLLWVRSHPWRALAVPIAAAAIAIALIYLGGEFLGWTG